MTYRDQFRDMLDELGQLADHMSHVRISEVIAGIHQGLMSVRDDVVEQAAMA
jgi:hypothetical protein